MRCFDFDLEAKINKYVGVLAHSSACLTLFL